MDCKRDLLKPEDLQEPDRPDETLIAHKTYKKEKNASTTRQTNQHTGLHRPSDETARVAQLILSVFHSNFNKNLHKISLKTNLILKCKRFIVLKERNWLQTDTCKEHRHYFIDKVLNAKIKRTLQEMSKDLRQPGGKSSTVYRKVQNLGNK